MKRLLNVLGALVSDLTQNELAARGACRCHKFRSGGFGMELHTYGQALWNAKNATGGNACVAGSRMETGALQTGQHRPSGARRVLWSRHARQKLWPQSKVSGSTRKLTQTGHSRARSSKDSRSGDVVALIYVLCFFQQVLHFL